MARALSATLLAAAALLVAVAPGATAGTYTVEACTPTSTPGDSVVRPIVSASFNALFFPCGNMIDGGIRVAAGTRAPSGEPVHGLAGWTILAPQDTTIEQVQMERLFTFMGANGMRWQVLKPGGGIIESVVAEGLPPPPSGGVTYDVNAPSVTGVFECPNAVGCMGPTGTFSAVTSRGFHVRFADALPPTATLPAPGGTLRGTVNVPYESADRGGGVLLARLILDPGPGAPGRTVAEHHDGNGGKCEPPFKALVPCRLQLTSSFRLDTTRIPDGQHTLAVQILDAAANLALGASVPIVVQNPADPPPDPDPDPDPRAPRPPSADTTPPVLSSVSLSRKGFRRGKTTLRFTSSEAATLSVTVAKAPRKKAGAPRKPLATLTRTIAAGPGRLALGKHLGHKRLRPGRYLLSITARDAAGNLSRVRRLGFTILPG